MTTPPIDAAAQEPGEASGPRRRPAMQDVAKMAGVSHQTVSRVLNRHASVSPRTRALVLAAIDELGYRPNSAARTLVTGKSKTLGLVTIAGTLYGPMSMLYGIEAAAREQGYMLTIANVGDGERGSVERALLNLQRQDVEGIIVIAPLTSIGDSLSQHAQNLPLVAVESSVSATLPVVSVDQAAGARAATEHLLDLGHQTVWHVTGPADWYESQDRTAGWAQTLAARGIEQPPLLHGDWSPKSGYAAGQILSRMPDVTAIFASNDTMALGILLALREHGRETPGDVSVVGFDDTPEAAFFSPPLTTVRQPFDAVGRRSLDVLIARIQSGNGSNDRVVLPPELVVRQSTGQSR